MEAFAVFVEAGSFVHASAHLGLTASAVTKQGSKLESTFSIRLLERNTRRLKVNAEGAQIDSHGEELLGSSVNVFRLKESFFESPQGLIRIAVPRSLLGRCHQLIPGFLKQYPDVDVQFISNVGALGFVRPSGAMGRTAAPTLQAVKLKP